jgi:hypothetical protein
MRRGVAGTDKWHVSVTFTSPLRRVAAGWEGVEAEMKGVELNVFELDSYGIPYGYRRGATTKTRCIGVL